MPDDPFAPAPEGWRPTLDHTDTIPRVWRHKDIHGKHVYVRRYLRVDNVERRVVYHDPDANANLSCTLEDFQKQYEPIGELGVRRRIHRTDET